MARVYVSSTYADLMECRIAVSAALRKLGHQNIAMEDYAADVRRPLDRCLADIDSCDLYIGIFAWRYGYVPPQQTRSITELEYRHALRTNKDRLIFLLAEGAPWPEARIESAAFANIVALRNELKEHTGIDWFTGPADLYPAVVAAVALWEKSESKRPSVQLAPPLPAHYIERPALVNDLVAELLNDSIGQPGILVVSALHGLGGIGKTAAATAIAHHHSIRAHFTGGTLWATLGQNPDCLSHLAAWIQALGDQEYRPTTTIAATSYLRTLLYTTTTLLVIDDVWDLGQATPFLAGGPKCRLLVTTRRAEVADALGAHLYSIKEMTPQEAVNVLRKRVEAARPGQPLTSAEYEHAAALAHDTGYLPLALALMGALVARGYPWADARAALQREQRRRTGTASRSQTTLEATLQLSLDYLRKIDSIGWENVARLGVLSDGVTINPRVASVLWNIPASDAKQLLNSIADDAILQRNGLAFRVHDLMHDVVRNALTSPAPAGLGVSLLQAHSELLANYDRTIATRRWDQLADDGYIHSHLLWHLDQAGERESIHALLGLANEEGRHAWYAARDQLGQAAGFIADLMTSWRLVRKDQRFRFGKQFRYALMLASLHSLAQVITPKMLYLLVERRIWPAAKALDSLQRIIDDDKRGAALLELTPLLLEQTSGPGAEAAGRRQDLLDTLLRETEAVIASNIGPLLAAKLLIAIGSQLSEEHRDVLVARAVALTDGKPSTLKNLARNLPASLRDQIIERAAENCQGPGDSFVRIRDLADVVTEFSLPEKEGKWTVVLQQWTEAIFDAAAKPQKASKRQKKWFWEKAEKSPPPAPEPAPSPALEKADAVAVAVPANDAPPEPAEEETEIDSPSSILQFLLERRINLPEEWCLRFARRLPAQDQGAIAQALQQRARRATTAEERALELVAERFDTLLRTRFIADLDELVMLVPKFPADRRDQAVSDIMKAYERSSSEEGGELLTRLAPYASAAVCRAEIETLTDESGSMPIGAQCLLANFEPEQERKERFDQVIAALSSVWRSQDIEYAMLSIIRVAPPEVIYRAVASLQKIDDAPEQIGAVFVVAPYLPGGLSIEISQFLEDRAGNKTQIVTLTRMVTELSNAMSGGVLADFVHEAARLSSEWWIVEALTLTMLRLDDRERLSAILKAAKYITATDLKARLLSRLALRLARAGFLHDAIEATATVPLASDRWIILGELAIDLAMTGRSADAQATAEAIENSEERSKATAEVTLHLAAGGQVQQARTIAAAIPNGLWRTWIQERLDLIRLEDDLGSTPHKKRSAFTSVLSEQVDFELLRPIVEGLIWEAPQCAELRELATASAAKNVQQTIDAARRFWRAKAQGEKTYLEIIAEQPRPRLLNRLQQLAPLLTPCLTGADAEDLVSAVREVSMWWP